RPCVISILSGIHHLLSFLRIKIRDVSAERQRLSLDLRIDIEVDAPADGNRDRRPDNRYTMTAHEDHGFLTERLRQCLTFLRIAYQHIRHSEGFSNIEDWYAISNERNHVIHRPQRHGRHAQTNTNLPSILNTRTPIT